MDGAVGDDLVELRARREAADVDLQPTAAAEVDVVAERHAAGVAVGLHGAFEKHLARAADAVGLQGSQKRHLRADRGSHRRRAEHVVEERRAAGAGGGDRGAQAAVGNLAKDAVLSAHKPQGTGVDQTGVPAGTQRGVVGQDGPVSVIKRLARRLQLAAEDLNATALIGKSQQKLQTVSFVDENLAGRVVGHANVHDAVALDDAGVGHRRIRPACEVTVIERDASQRADRGLPRRLASRRRRRHR